jgi:hypothetical protein
MANYEYVWFVFNLLSHYCSNYPYFVSGIRKGKGYFALGFDTRRLPCITELYELFYLNKKKVIPDNIYNLLTPIALAHLLFFIIMPPFLPPLMKCIRGGEKKGGIKKNAGDGSSMNGGVVICTDSFTIQDVVSLTNVLIIRYGLSCSI